MSLYIDIDNRKISGTAKVSDIKKYGLIQASVMNNASA
jgi:hypothetical protein